MIHTLPIKADNEIKYLVGSAGQIGSVKPFEPYDGLVCEFLNSLSALLLADVEAKKYHDVVSFAYWCRRANILKLKQEFVEKLPRLGLGLVFHIAPSNVPINFAFSFAFSLLAGNANVVRVPSKDFVQTDILCRAINCLFEDERYKKISNGTCFIKYPQNDEITSSFSKVCNARIIWGGDKTIRNIRAIPAPERAIDVVFADRYSFCVIDADGILNLDEFEMKKLANNFFNDAYLMDQNACSSPHLIAWLNGDKTPVAKDRFWNIVYEIAEFKYEIEPVSAMDKYMLFCEDAIELNNVVCFKKHDNYLYRIELSSLPDNLDSYRGKFGYFYEYNVHEMNDLAHIVNTKYQTLTYFGIDKSKLLGFVMDNHLTGIDRIVPIGSALDIGVIWDGYDIVRKLSRVIDCR